MAGNHDGVYKIKRMLDWGRDLWEVTVFYYKKFYIYAHI